SVEANYTASVDDGAAAAAHNVDQHNVEPSAEMTITAGELASNDGGFVVSSIGDGRGTVPGLNAQTGFGYRMQSYLEVPETGTYQFATQSPAGAEAVLYTDDGPVQISAPNSWQPAELADTCSLKSDEYVAHNPRTGGPYYYSDPNPNHHHETWTTVYKHAEDDDSWYADLIKVADGEFHHLRHDMCAFDEPRWGGPTVELQAGVQYPVDMRGWVGNAGGSIGLHVQRADLTPQPVPISWMTPATFESTVLPATQLDDDLVAFTGDAHGDLLYGIDTDGTLIQYHSDGLGGWERGTTLNDVAAPRDVDRETVEPIHGDIEGVTLEPSEGSIAFSATGGSLVGPRLSARGSDNQDGTYRSNSVNISALEFTLDEFGGVVDGHVVGDITRYEIPPSTIDPVSVRGGGLQADGTLRLVVSNPDGTVSADLVFPVPERPVTGTYAVTGDDLLIGGHAPTTTNGGTVTVTGQYGSLDGVVTAEAEEGGPQQTSHLLTMESMNFVVADDLTITDATIGGSVRTVDQATGVDYTAQLHDLTGRYDPTTGHLELAAKASFRTVTMVLPLTHAAPAPVAHSGMATSADGATLIVATDPWVGGEVVVLTKGNDGTFEPQAHFADLYSVAGVEEPAEPSHLGGRAPQSVQMTPDGDIVAVMQPTGDSGHRVDVAERASGSQWEIVGSFETEISLPHATDLAYVPFAIGSEHDDRYVAVVNGDNVEIHHRRGDGDWELGLTTPVAGAVTSMSFDYYGRHLAIGQPHVGTVTVLERAVDPTTHTRSATDWVFKRDLHDNALDRFGSTVSWGYGNLAVTSDGTYRPGGSGPDEYSAATARIYSSASQNWDDFSWVKDYDLGTGTGPHGVVIPAGTKTSPAITTATVATLNTYWTIAGMAPINGY
ncbi:MAG: hypothetical protein AAGA42_18975, partial [Actinomycetota bacterium]